MYEETIDLSHLPAEGLRIERRINPNAWKIHEQDWDSRGELHFHVLIRGNTRKVTVEGSFSAQITAECHRCLKEIPLDLTRSFHLTYLTSDRERFAKEEVELTGDELEVAYLDSGFLPLHELIREQIYLALPMKFLCEAECRGLCAHCGANLNEVECDCPKEEVDPRWAALKAIESDRD
ncbi:MAG: hypothetical protein C5B54_05475 [Acidobacteria bacterium]|nr:MAG: hypothetical protein C5B54_05475 [Acidobacteriota bacterium]